MKITDKTVNICKYPLIKKKKKRNKRTWIRHKRLSINLIWTEKKKKQKNTNSREGFSISLVFSFFFFRPALPALSPHPADSRLRGGVTAPAAAPAELPVVAFPRASEQEAPAVLSREQLPDLSSSRDFTQYGTCPREGGLMKGELGRSNSREKRATAGPQRQELPGIALL